MHGEGYGSVDGHISLTYRIATLHVEYHKNVSEILWFGQLVAFSPGIMDQLKEETVSDKSEMVGLLSYYLPFYSKLFGIDSSSMCSTASPGRIGSKSAS